MARFYLPWLGRWVSTDPIEIEDDINFYKYCKCDPIDRKDKAGTQPEEVQESDSAQLMSIWPYGVPVPDRERVGHNVQRHHVVEASVRAAQRRRTGAEQRAISAEARQSTILVETGRGYYHTIVGRYLREIRLRIKSGMLTSESDLIDAVRQAHQLAAEETGVTLSQSVLDRAILEDQGLVHETLEATRAELQTIGRSGSTTVTDASIDQAFSDPARRRLGIDVDLSGVEELLSRIGSGEDGSLFEREVSSEPLQRLGRAIGVRVADIETEEEPEEAAEEEAAEVVADEAPATVPVLPLVVSPQLGLIGIVIELLEIIFSPTPSFPTPASGLAPG